MNPDREVVGAGIRQYELGHLRGGFLLEQTTSTGSVQSSSTSSRSSIPGCRPLPVPGEIALKLAARLGIATLGPGPRRPPGAHRAHGGPRRAPGQDPARRKAQHPRAGGAPHRPRGGGPDGGQHPRRLKSVSRIILYFAKDFDGEGYPVDGTGGRDLPLEARILHVAADFGLEGLHSRHSRAVALERMRLSKGRYDPDVLGGPGQLLGTDDPAEGRHETHRLLNMDELAPTGPGRRYPGPQRHDLPAGKRLSMIHLERLRSLVRLGSAEEPFLRWTCPE